MNTNGKAKKWKEYYRKLHTYVDKMVAYEKSVQEYCYSFEDGVSKFDVPVPPNIELPTLPINN